MTTMPLLPTGENTSSLQTSNARAGAQSAPSGGLFAAFFDLFSGAEVDGEATALIKNLTAAQGEKGTGEQGKGASLKLLLGEVQKTLQQLSAGGVDISKLENAADLKAAFKTIGFSDAQAGQKALRTGASLQALGLYDGKDLDAEIDILPSEKGDLVVQELVFDHAIEQVLKMRQQVEAFSAAMQGSPITDVAERAKEGLPLLDQSSRMNIIKYSDNARASQLQPDEDMLIEQTVRLIGRQETAKNNAGAVSEVKLAKGDVPAPMVQDNRPVEKAQKGLQEAIQRVQQNDVAATKAAPRLQEVAAAQAGQATTVSKPEIVQKGKSTAALERGAERAEGTGVSASFKVSEQQPQGPMQGKVIYQWLAAKDGSDILQQVNQYPAGQAVAAAEMSAAEMEAVDEMLEQMQLQPRNNDAVKQELSLTRQQFSSLVQRSQVASQVSVQMRNLAAQNGGDARLILNPPELGEIEVRLEVRGGQVSGVISAQNPEVLEQLARDLHLLRQGLADAGLDLAEGGFQLLLGDESGQEQNGENDENSQFAGSAQEGEELANEVAAGGDETWLDPDRLLDTKV